MPFGMIDRFLDPDLSVARDHLLPLVSLLVDPETN
jgi:hypothetical protein